MKIRPVGAELFHEDKRTDMTKITVTSRNSANAPKNWYLGTSMNIMHVVLDYSSLYGFYMQPKDGFTYQVEICWCNCDVTF